MSSPGTILLQNVEDIEEDSGNSLFFSRIGECKVGSDGCQGFGCVAVSRTNGLIYLASGTGTFAAMRLEARFLILFGACQCQCRYILYRIICDS